MSRPTIKQVAAGISEIMDKHAASADKIAKEVAAYLVQERRTRDHDPIMKALIKLREEQGIVEVNASSARELDDATKKEILELLSARLGDNKEIVLTEEVDDNLVGGVRLDSANIRIDMTIRNKLTKLKQVTVNNS